MLRNFNVSILWNFYFDLPGGVKIPKFRHGYSYLIGNEYLIPLRSEPVSKLELNLITA